MGKTLYLVVAYSLCAIHEGNFYHTFYVIKLLLFIQLQRTDKLIINVRWSFCSKLIRSIDVDGFTSASCWPLCPPLDTHHIYKVKYNLHFKNSLQSPVPCIHSWKPYTTSWFCQQWSDLFLNILVLCADTIQSGRLQEIK